MRRQKHGPNIRTEQNSTKAAKQNREEQSIRCRGQMVRRIFKELSEDLNSIKKILGNEGFTN